ncbi:HD domain-containing phosphohydrolase [Ideonella oryzae]|uniref:Response regulator n=1 Tax=Ideonella oryzae TaxID=2937441 RepID=A0ABT1BJH6_9BURK|nr:HD domain-containing phosphohydrolase [Ideonella oryzae]MCO5976351.1 response regulator [Ideonella oryzae]
MTSDTTAPALASRAPFEGATLLLVDDESGVLNALRRLFRGQGYTVLLASSGAEGLQILAQQPVDLVLSDMRMPEMDGAQFLAQVRQRHPQAVRLLLTGYADIGSTIAAINQGEIHRYIAKPWNDPDLLLTVQEALRRRQLELENQQLLAQVQAQNQALAELNQGLEQRVKARTAEIEQINDMLEKAYEELNENFMVAVTVFSGLLEMREGAVAGHARRVAALVKRMAPHLQLDERAQQEVYLGALLHDIGTIGFPDRMLGRPLSVLVPEDLARYRHHPKDGEAALMPLARLHGVGRIVRQHHERVDGKGFPDGLEGEAIALGARIVAVASDYDDLTHGAMSEQPHSRHQALQAIRGGVGTHYDGRMVAALEAVLAEPDPEAQDDLCIEATQLRPGMVLARDLLSSKGALLLAAGYVFEERVIRQIREFVAGEGLRLTLHVRRPQMEAPRLTPPPLPQTALSGEHHHA